MRASAACQITLQRAGWWRAGIAALTLVALMALTAWVVQSPPATSPRLMMAAGAAACIVAASSLWRVARGTLRWDGQRWSLDDIPGTLNVAIDLGPWMLLRYRAEGDGARPCWLPLQRRGLEAQWHALRCAVHAS